MQIGLGEHGQRDYASPHGHTDMLDRTWQLAFTNEFRRNELIEHGRAATAIGGPAVLEPAGRRLRGTAHRRGLEIRDPAELLLVDGETRGLELLSTP
ncbi:hypothetical protein BA895_10615 [Humibacillus sp. DSM 29435]|uniref:hypothetical protein n=1 Tax=Humibacillus sp. DSM 29435 TaxID=1869167 RepID=UPI000871E6A6|nr:hypothetical protein [Humibacillus sp. DSM 29435]OFE14407.1 hypothetical protein BA895_10615 [Humibacillus sp. DSM 29435]